MQKITFAQYGCRKREPSENNLVSNGIAVAQKHIFNFPIKGCLQALKRAPNPVAKLTSQHLRLSKTGNGRGGEWWGGMRLRPK